MCVNGTVHVFWTVMATARVQTLTSVVEAVINVEKSFFLSHPIKKNNALFTEDRSASVCTKVEYVMATEPYLLYITEKCV